MDRNVEVLTEEEWAVLAYVADGYSFEQMGRKLNITESKVSNHFNNMLHKNGFVNSFQLVNWAYREGILR